MVYTGSCGQPGDGYLNLAEFRVFYGTDNIVAGATNNDGDNRVWASAAYGGGDPDTALDGDAVSYYHGGSPTGGGRLACGIDS